MKNRHRPEAAKAQTVVSMEIDSTSNAPRNRLSRRKWEQGEYPRGESHSSAAAGRRTDYGGRAEAGMAKDSTCGRTGKRKGKRRAEESPDDPKRGRRGDGRKRGVEKEKAIPQDEPTANTPRSENASRVVPRRGIPRQGRGAAEICICEKRHLEVGKLKVVIRSSKIQSMGD